MAGTSRRVGNSSGKYDFNPEKFEADIRNKSEMINQAQCDIVELLDGFVRADYRYSDNIPMSPGQKWTLIIDAAIQVKEKYGL